MNLFGGKSLFSFSWTTPLQPTLPHPPSKSYLQPIFSKKNNVDGYTVIGDGPHHNGGHLMSRGHHGGCLMPPMIPLMCFPIM